MDLKLGQMKLKCSKLMISSFRNPFWQWFNPDPLPWISSWGHSATAPSCPRQLTLVFKLHVSCQWDGMENKLEPAGQNVLPDRGRPRSSSWTGSFVNGGDMVWYSSRRLVKVCEVDRGVFVGLEPRLLIAGCVEEHGFRWTQNGSSMIETWRWRNDVMIGWSALEPKNDTKPVLEKWGSK